MVGVLNSCGTKTKTLSFKNCQVTYEEYSGGDKELYTGHYMTNEMQLESAQRKLAACLCEDYVKSHDSVVKSKIIELYNEKESYFPPSTRITTNDFDSILKHRKELFDATILID
jgi:hypothetical protein